MRKLALALAAVMMMSSLAGCSQKSETPADTGKTEDTAAPAAPAAEAAGGAGSGAAGGSDTVAAPKSPEKYSLGSGSTGGNFYLVGGGISTAINNLLPDYFMVTTETTGGSTANLTMIQNGEAELGIAMTSSLAEAAAGEADWTGGQPLDKVRGLIPLYPSYMTIYALKSSGINTLSDLNGKVVGLGSKGAAMDNSLRVVFDKLGIQPKSIYNDGHGATASAVSDGTVDAAVLFSYPPFSAIAELEATKDLTFIGLTDDELKQMSDIYGFYSETTLPAGSYKGITEDVKTVSEWNMLVTSSEVPEDYAYLMTKTLLENNDVLKAVHESCQYATAENCMKFNIPLHAGTVKYLKEIGLDVPDNLCPPEYQQ